MALKDILKPKHDDEIYQKLKVEKPTFELFGLVHEHQKSHLLAKLLKDNQVDGKLWEAWRKLIQELKKSIDIILESQ